MSGKKTFDMVDTTEWLPLRTQTGNKYVIFKFWEMIILHINESNGEGLIRKDS